MAIRVACHWSLCAAVPSRQLFRQFRLEHIVFADEDLIVIKMPISLAMDSKVLGR